MGRLQDLAGLRTQTDELMGLGWVMLGIMLAFGVVLAAAILDNTATIGILERRRDLATRRAMGWTMREIALWLTLEHAMLAVLGLMIGIPVSVVVSRRVMASFSSDLFTFPFVLSTGTLGVGIAGVLLVLLFAQWPALRQVSRDSLAGAVRSREG